MRGIRKVGVGGALLLLLAFGQALRAQEFYVDFTDTPILSLASTPQLSIGQVGGTQYEFYRVADALFLEDGRILVVNGGSNELRLFTGAGEYIRSFGASGRGPGEFVGIANAFVIDGQRVVAWDNSLRRATVVQLDDGSYHTVRLSPMLDGAQLVGLTAADELVLVDTRYGGVGAGEISRAENHWFRYTLDGTRVDSLGAGPGFAGPLHRMGAGLSLRMMLFAPTTTYSVAGGHLWFETGEGHEVKVLDLSSRAVRRYRWSGPRREATAEDVEAEIKRRALRISEEDGRAELRRDLASSPVADSIPGTLQVLTDELGHGWVARYPDPTRDLVEWVVLDARSVAVMRVRTPRNSIVMDVASDRVLVVEKDAFDLEYVRAYALVDATRR